MKIADYIIKKDPSSLSVLHIQNDFSLTSSETSSIKTIFEQTHDGSLLSTTFYAILKNHELEEKLESKLVMTGDFHHDDVSYTHSTIYDMIRRAKISIVIIGYWVYDLEGLFQELSKLQECRNELRIKFILNDADNWASEIKENWNKKFRSNLEILTIDKHKIPGKLHSKVIIIDEDEMLITSANLTINAMEKNIETGVLLHNKKLIKSCIDVFDDFRNRSILTQIPNFSFGDV